MTTFNTLLLDTAAWDLVLDINGNIAVASPPYALAQDVASAVKTFLGEVYYNQNTGLPWEQNVLGQLPPTSVLVQLINQQALTVPGVVSVNTTINSFVNRVPAGTIAFVDENNQTTVINF